MQNVTQALEEGFMKLTMSYQAPPIEDLLENHRKYKEAFNQPMKLGVKKAISIVTCMDSRVMPAKIFGLDIGDAEYIRNGGGRVTDDVIRSLVLTNELLQCKMIILLHHTDCGAQAAAKYHDFAVKKVKDKLGADLNQLEMYPIEPPNDEGLRQSVVDDLEKLKASPFIDPNIPIYGYIYDVTTADLTEIARYQPS
jgi:carbonic anhydrase